MPEIGTSGLMSGDGKRGGASASSARARPRLYSIKPTSVWWTNGSNNGVLEDCIGLREAWRTPQDALLDVDELAFYRWEGGMCERR